MKSGKEITIKSTAAVVGLSIATATHLILEGLDRFNGLLRLSDGNKTQGWSIDGMFYKSHWNSTDQVPLSSIQSGQLGRFQALNPTDGGDSERAVVSGEWHGIDDQGYSKALLYAEHYQPQLFSDFTFFENHCVVAPNPNLPCDQFQQWENRNSCQGVEPPFIGKRIDHRGRPAGTPRTCACKISFPRLWR